MNGGVEAPWSRSLILDDFGQSSNQFLNEYDYNHLPVTSNEQAIFQLLLVIMLSSIHVPKFQYWWNGTYVDDITPADLTFLSINSYIRVDFAHLGLMHMSYCRNIHTVYAYMSNDICIR